MSESLQGQVALIIGAGRQPAPILAQALAAQGAILAVNDLSPILLDPLVERIQAQGGQIHSYIADATRGMPLRAMLDEVLDECGKIDILINNPRIQPASALLDIDEYDWQRTIEMNLNGPFMVSQLVARLMRDQGQGVILNIVDTDPNTLQASGRAAYAASQAGLLALSQAASRELIAYNIRVHTLCPQFEPAGASGRMDEAFGQAAVFLCSPLAAHLNGQVITTSQVLELPDLDALKKD